MSAIDAYVRELEAALHVRGAARRRFLRECRDHLADCAAERGEVAAVRVFGSASEVAAAFDTEVAAGRGVRSTFAAAAGVLATGASTLALIHAAASSSSGPTGWAIVFFVAAQVAGVAAALAVLQALVLRRSAAQPADVRLLVRRNGCALVAAGVAMFAAGAALPGSGSPALLLAGPCVAIAAACTVLRARALARRLGGASERVVRPPLVDLGRLLGLRMPALDAPRLLALTTVCAAAAAFVRDRGEHDSVGGALVTGGIEAAAVVACFIVLGPALGLWRRAARS